MITAKPAAAASRRAHEGSPAFRTNCTNPMHHSLNLRLLFAFPVLPQGLAITRNGSLATAAPGGASPLGTP